MVSAAIDEGAKGPRQREHLRLARRMFWLELSLERPNSLKVAIFAPKSIYWSCNISNLPSKEIAIIFIKSTG